MAWRVALGLLALASAQVTGTNVIPVDYVENISNQEAWQTRIVSGWEARVGQHPHQVSLRMVDAAATVSACGGSVVARQWILTSAHCTATRITIVVRAGLVSLTRPEILVESAEYYNFPTFDSSKPLEVQPDDISLLKLPISLEYNRNVRAIRVQPSADAFRNYDERVLYASGFGRTWTAGVTTEELRWVYLRGVSNPSCAAVFGTRFVTANSICARYFNVTSQSICQGDSGGPLVAVDERGMPQLVGISSFVAGEPFGCHSGLPAGFIRPGPFHWWFTEVTGIDFNNLNEDNTTTSSAPITTTTNTPTVITTTTSLPTITTSLPTTTTSLPTTVTIPSTAITTTTTTIPTNTTTNIPTTTSSPPPTTTDTPDDSNDDDEDDDEDDPELSELMKKLEVKVKVMVRLNKGGRNKKENM